MRSNGTVDALKLCPIEEYTIGSEDRVILSYTYERDRNNNTLMRPTDEKAWYWQARGSRDAYGPFKTRKEAEADYLKDAPAPARLCEITEASMEDSEGRGDGAYDLLDINGTPEEIGAHIADALALGGLGDTDLIDAGKELFLTVRIKIKKGSA